MAEKTPLRDCTAIIPACNEAEGIAHVLRDLSGIDIIKEIIVVDDGSSDGTVEEAERAGIAHLRIIRHDQNLGYGAALKTGIRAAHSEWILIIDADGTYPAERIPDLAKEASEADMVVGARIGANAAIPAIRRPAKWMLNRLANYLAQQKIPDLNSGLRLIRRSALEPFMRLLPQGFSFTTTITLAMLVNNYRVRYVPIDYHPRKGRSKIRPLRDTLNFVQLILRTILYFDPLRVFLPLSVLLFLGAFLVFLIGQMALPRIPDGTVLVLFVSGLQMLVLGLVADLINRRTTP